MCRAVTCPVCGKTTWAGCGQHVDAVRRSVPADQWCPGHSDAERAAATELKKARSFGFLRRS